MPYPIRVAFAALPFLLLLLLLLAVFRHPGADKLTRMVGGVFAVPLIFVALSPGLALGPGASPRDQAWHLATVGGGLVLLALLFGRRNLE